MFRFSTIITELALNPAKVVFMLKHSVKLRHLLCGLWQHVMEWRVCCMLCIVHSMQHSRHSMTCFHTTA